MLPKESAKAAVDPFAGLHLNKKHRTTAKESKREEDCAEKTSVQSGFCFAIENSNVIVRRK
jgi:hypothetical protein